MLSCVWIFAIPWTVTHQAPQSVRFPKQEYWSGLPFPPLRDLPDPGIELATPLFPAFQVDSLPTEPSRKPSEDTHPKSTVSLPCVILAALQLACWLMWPLDYHQFSCWVMSNSLWPHGQQHTRLSCPSPTLGMYCCSNLCPLSWQCHPAISYSVVPSSPCLLLLEYHVYPH